MKFPDGMVYIYKQGRIFIEVEAKELIMCRNCKRWKDPHDYECPYHTSGDPYIDDDPDEDFYCAMAEKIT